MWILIKLYSSTIWKYAFPMIKDFLSQEFVVATIEVQKALVATRDISGLTTTQRRDMIFKMVVEQMLKQGYSISYSIIYSAIKGVVKA